MAPLDSSAKSSLRFEKHNFSRVSFAIDPPVANSRSISCIFSSKSACCVLREVYPDFQSLPFLTAPPALLSLPLQPFLLSPYASPCQISCRRLLVSLGRQPIDLQVVSPSTSLFRSLPPTKPRFCSPSPPLVVAFGSGLDLREAKVLIASRSASDLLDHTSNKRWASFHT